MLAGVPEAVTTIVCGHTHMPFTRLANRRLIVNPGSIGMPYGHTGAPWALLGDGGVQLRRSNFDIELARRSIRETSTFPEIDDWTDEYLYSRNSDADAIEAFGPRDGRPQ